jgi:hypothetical protein
MLKRLWNALRSRKPPVESAVDCQPPKEPAPIAYPGRPETQGLEERPPEAYIQRPKPLAYSWTYDGTTVRYGDSSWQYHEPDTYRTKALNDRFYNELSPQHVDQLLSKWAGASQKGRVRERLENAAHVAYMRRKQSTEAAALADLLTRQCVELYREQCSSIAIEWRAKFLVEEDRANEAVDLLTKHLKTRLEEFERDRLQKVLRAAEKGRTRAERTARPQQPLSPVEPEKPTLPSDGEVPPFPEGWGPLSAVGESQYQPALQRAAQFGRVCWATLLPEPHNPFDGNAVAVQIQGETVGYLSRADARRYQSRLQSLKQPMNVPAKLIGGTSDKPSFGLMLDCRELERMPKPRRNKVAIDPKDQAF